MFFTVLTLLTTYIHGGRERERDIYICVCVCTHICVYIHGGLLGTRLVREADVMSLEVADCGTAVTLAILRDLHW